MEFIDIKNGKKIKNIEDISPSLRCERGIREHFPSLYDRLLLLPQNLTFKEKLYWVFHNIKERPVCKICGKEVRFMDTTKGYCKHCSVRCHNRDREEIKRIFTEKWGEDNPMKVKSIRKKQKKTIKEKYGVENISQLDEIKRKKKETCKKHYGVENILQQSDNIYSPIPNTKGEILYRCPHPECTLCKERFFYNTPQRFSLRKEFAVEPCTRILPINSRSSSTLEEIICGWLNDWNIKYERHNRELVKPMEVDIWIEDRGIAIECNGVYFHNDKHREREYHREKFRRCEERGVQLLTIWEDWIREKEEIVRDILKIKLGVCEEGDRRVGGRECRVEEIESKEIGKFLDENHLQGKVGGKVRLGLRNKEGELLGVMVWGRGRGCMGRKEEDKEEWEMLRYCVRRGVRVVGGMSKMMKYFIDNYHPRKIISFSMNDISNGNLYKQLGFHMKNETIGYWYIKDGKRYHRGSFMKKKLIEEGEDSNKTEEEIMKGRGYNKIFDSGQRKWALDM